jgi:O-antigen/teichoic acid export membrane protein
MQLVLNPGLSASYVYFTASGRIRVRDLTTHAVAVALLVGIAAPCIVEILRVTGLLHHLIPDVPIGLVLLAAVVLPLSVFLGLMTSILQGQQRISLMNRLSILNSAATLIAVGTFLIVMDMGPPGALLGGAAGNVIAAAVVALALRRDGARFVPALHHTHIKNLVGYGIRAQGGNVVQFTNYRFDQLVLNHVAGPAAVGLYSLAVSLAELLWQLPNAVSTIIFPTRLSRFRQRQILMNTGVV